ncbi:DNA repair protein RAD51 homolog 4-like isoform X2 [Mangifera indica]|uniref:DNA repair protein RAD51 homolog 4-like isoform X2 n=1 Tax=Mangifera indica TaxID=29780 RepID=UPI001CFB2787|nr:DNA repair protein RAD51 homolog 4-like isoform X2 [Mangifera indica]
MAPLKSLETEYPIIDANFQNFCASHAIFSVEDFVLHDLYQLAAFAEQQPTSERLKEGITQVFNIIDNLHQPWLNGMELLEDYLQNKHVLSTGFEGVDLLLQGGLREGQLTELVGPSSSGKTQFCLQTAANVAVKNMGYVVYLDTGNSFSAQRIAHFVGQITDSAFIQAKQKIIQKAMSSIMDRGEYRVRLLIVDSISSLITPVLGGSGSQGRALMISAGFLLKKLAHEHNLAVLVTNHTVGGDGGVPKPALGESWKSVPHVRLFLSRNCGSNICNMSILKHPSMASGKAADFVIEL